MFQASQQDKDQWEQDHTGHVREVKTRQVPGIIIRYDTCVDCGMVFVISETPEPTEES